MDFQRFAHECYRLSKMLLPAFRLSSRAEQQRLQKGKGSHSPTTRGSISFDDGALIAAYVDGHVDRRAIAISQNQTLPPSKGASMLPSPLVAPLPRS